MPFEVHPEYHKNYHESLSLKGARPMTASMARAKKSFEHQVAWLGLVLGLGLGLGLGF